MITWAVSGMLLVGSKSRGTTEGAISAFLTADEMPVLVKRSGLVLRSRKALCSWSRNKFCEPSNSSKDDF